LGRIKDLDFETYVSIDDESQYASACHNTVDEFESADSQEEIFKRRMGMRNYLKHLRMGLNGIKKAKQV